MTLIIQLTFIILIFLFVFHERLNGVTVSLGKLKIGFEMLKKQSEEQNKKIRKRILFLILLFIFLIFLIS